MIWLIGTLVFFQFLTVFYLFRINYHLVNVHMEQKKDKWKGDLEIIFGVLDRRLK